MMTKRQERDRQNIDARRARHDMNIFARLPSVYSASRVQAQRILQASAGLSTVEWRVLWDLHDAGPMTIRDLAEVQRADHSLLSRALPEMRRKGYVVMERDTDDGRQTIVTLTDEGQAAYGRAAPAMARRRAALREFFSPEDIATFIRLLDEMDEFLSDPLEAILDPQELVK